MANTFKFGNGNWAVKDGYALAYNDENNNFKPLPFDFTRASSATTLNRQGLIETVGSGKPRIDFTDNTDGHLLLEPSRTNKLVRSNGFNTTWTLGSALSLTSGQTSTLTGNNNAWLLSNNGTSGFSALTQAVSISGSHTYSIFAKKGTNNLISLRSLSGTDARAEFNLNTGVLNSTSNTSSTEIKSYGNDWYRVSMTFSASNSFVYVYPNSIGTADSGNIYIQNAQLEAGSYATSYIPTEGLSETRVADGCFQGGLTDKGILNNSAITIYLETDIQSDTLTNYQEIIALYNDANSVNLRLETRTTNQLYVQHTGVVSSGSNFNNLSLGSNSVNLKKIAIYLTTTQFKIFADGSQLYSTYNGTYNLDFDRIGFRIYNNIVETLIKNKEIKLYNTALTDTELQNLTS